MIRHTKIWLRLNFGCVDNLKVITFWWCQLRVDSSKSRSNRWKNPCATSKLRSSKEDRRKMAEDLQSLDDRSILCHSNGEPLGFSLNQKTYEVKIYTRRWALKMGKNPLNIIKPNNIDVGLPLIEKAVVKGKLSSNGEALMAKLSCTRWKAWRG